MPRVFSQKAAKDYPAQGIKKGEVYYSWTFKNRRGRGTRVMSKTRPKPSQLTRSEYLSAALQLQERVEALEATSDLPGEVESIIEDVRALGDEQDEKFNNMPEGLQQGDTGQLLEQRRDACNEFADELEAIDLSEWEQDDDESKEECDDCCGTGRVHDDRNGRDKEIDCEACHGTGKVDKDEPCNSDGETEQEYWEQKLGEVQSACFNIE